MESGKSAGGLPFPTVPTVIFTHWREVLHQSKLSAAAQAGYSLAITGYVDYCRLNGISVTAESARAYMADVQRRGRRAIPAYGKKGQLVLP